MSNLPPVGSRVGLMVAGEFGPVSHEVVGHDAPYVRICPIKALPTIRPGQVTVPVTRIRPERLRIVR